MKNCSRSYAHLDASTMTQFQITLVMISKIKTSHKSELQ